MILGLLKLSFNITCEAFGFAKSPCTLQHSSYIPIDLVGSEIYQEDHTFALCSVVKILNIPDQRLVHGIAPIALNGLILQFYCWVCAVTTIFLSLASQILFTELCLWIMSAIV